MSDLGRLIPPDWVHVEKYPYLIDAEPERPMPIIVGTNWYQAFDKPIYSEKDRRWYVALDGVRKLGQVRGGHAYAIKPDKVRDLYGWWRFYNQGTEGACVGFAGARVMSWLDRIRMDPWKLYRESQLVDSWASTPPAEGTSVRASVDVMRTVGQWPVVRGKTQEPSLDHGVKVNRWCRSVEEMYRILKSPRLERLGLIPFANSWGPLVPGKRGGYPKLVYMPAEVMDFLINPAYGQYGEATNFTPR